MQDRQQMDERAAQALGDYRRGDTEALGRLVELFRRPLYGFILNMTEGREDAEDIVQETWHRAIRNLDRFTERRFPGWLFRVAHNLVIDRVRRRKTALLHAQSIQEQMSADPVAASILPSGGPAPDTAAAGRDLGRQVALALRKIPPEQREVFLLRTEADLPFREIAALQGVSINTALARMQYALARLRIELRDEYEAWKRI